MDNGLQRNVHSIRAHSRQRTQGAVMVEGLVVITFLLLFLACIIFAHRLYTAKLATITEARTGAWLGALPGCEGGIVGGVLSGITAFSSLADAATPGVDLPDWANDDVGREPGRPSVRTVVAGPRMGGRSYRLRTRTSVACNEDGDDVNGDLIFNLFRAVRRAVPFEF